MNILCKTNDDLIQTTSNQINNKEQVFIKELPLSDDSLN